jgi:HSP20 family protein
MANIVHRHDPTTSMQPFGHRDPLRVMRDMLRWDPFRELGSFPSLDLQAFTPSFDVKETKDALVIQADLPGMSEKDVTISVAGNRLTISGERKAEETKEDESYYMFERTYGSFNRTFTLPEEVELDKVQAELKDGVLRLTLPKRPDAQAKKIQVKAGK